LWNLAEVAAYCRVCPGTVRRWRRLNQFPPPVGPGRRLLWPAAAVRAHFGALAKGGVT
jgi:hypothetical protein